jgi:hypothetical protein
MLTAEAVYGPDVKLYVGWGPGSDQRNFLIRQHKIAYKASFKSLALAF